MRGIASRDGTLMVLHELLAIIDDFIVIPCSALCLDWEGDDESRKEGGDEECGMHAGVERR